MATIRCAATIRVNTVIALSLIVDEFCVLHVYERYRVDKLQKQTTLYLQVYHLQLVGSITFWQLISMNSLVSRLYQSDVGNAGGVLTKHVYLRSDDGLLNSLRVSWHCVCVCVCVCV